jgi:hypothetical protein
MKNQGTSLMSNAMLRDYVPCPKCGDPVVSPIPQPLAKLRLKCHNPNCELSFTFDRKDIVFNTLISYDRETNRWKVDTYGGLGSAVRYRKSDLES